MNRSAKPRVVGFNHVALEVGDIEEALAFYGRLFEFELRGKSDTMAFIDLGDQFISLQKGRKQPPDDDRHFGLVVDNKEAARAALDGAIFQLVSRSKRLFDVADATPFAGCQATPELRVPSLFVPKYRSPPWGRRHTPPQLHTYRRSA
jgi:catechol 2,3-dioxygenase-like lactoylglutathione lyase family enzyme